MKPGWTKVKFGEVVRLCKDRSSNPEADGIERYVGLEHLEPEDLRIRSWGLVAEGTTFTSRFKPGQVLFGKRRAYQRKVAVADFEGVCSGDIYIFESADPKHLLPELLPFICQTDQFFEHAVGTSMGSLSPRTNWKQLKDFDLYLPPLLEQRRMLIVLQQALDTLEEIQRSLQAAHFVLRSQQKRFFFDVTKKEKIEIGAVADVQNGTTPSRKKQQYWDGTIPWLPTGKVNDRKITESDQFITQKALDECSLDLIPKGSTLIAMIGQGKTRGKAAKLHIEACINQNFAAVVPQEGINKEFVFYQLEANYERLRSWSHGTNQHALNCKLIKEFPIWVPSLDIQKEISIQIQATEDVIQKLGGRLHQIGLLLSRIREQALSTRVRL